jgi:Fe-S cluster biogenesis protein NfuA
MAARTIICVRTRAPRGAPTTGVDDVQVQVEEVIEIIRPAIQADGGDISLLDVDQESGIVTVELHGACVSCPASTVTMKAGIERIMKDRVPGVTAVVQPGEDAELGTAVSL